MKAENEELKDEMLSKAVNDGFNENGLSSNFTHKVMGKIDQLENAPKRKPLVAWWAWIIIGGMFGAAIILAITNTSMPDQANIVVDPEVYETYSEYSSYILAAMGVMAFFLIEQIIDYRRRFAP